MAENDFPRALSDRVGFLLAQAHMAARAQADRALERVGLTAREFGALAAVVSDGPISQRRLSGRLRMDPAAMVGVIDKLEEAGYIVRRRNLSDRREYALETTAKGRSLYARADRAVSEADEATIRDLDRRESARLVELLRKVAGASRPDASRG